MSYYYQIDKLQDTDMEAMKLRFGGGNEIDANTLINSLIHFTNIVQEVNKEVAQELSIERKIEIKIKANEPGSFIVDLAIQANSIAGAITNLFSKEGISYAANIVQVVAGVYSFAKFLGGKKPKEVVKSGNTMQITTSDGNITTYDFSGSDFRGANIYLGNPLVQAAITKEFETLNADENVTSLSLIDKEDNTIATIEKSEFQNLADPEEDEIITNSDTKVKTVNTILQIKEQDWAFTKGWVFYMNGHRITAKIKDAKFKESVLGRKDAFLAGDSLDVILEITQKLDRVTEVWVNKSYSVKEIRSHIKGAQQSGLF